MDSTTIQYGGTEDSVSNTTDAISSSRVYGVKSIDFIVATYVISIIGIPGNLVTMIVLLSSKSLRSKPINQFLIHQGFIGLLGCCFTIFEEFINNMNILVYPFICHMFISRTASGIAFYTSTYNMVISDNWAISGNHLSSAIWQWEGFTSSAVCFCIHLVDAPGRVGHNFNNNGNTKWNVSCWMEHDILSVPCRILHSTMLSCIIYYPNNRDVILLHQNVPSVANFHQNDIPLLRRIIPKTWWVVFFW